MGCLPLHFRDLPEPQRRHARAYRLRRFGALVFKGVPQANTAQAPGSVGAMRMVVNGADVVREGKKKRLPRGEPQQVRYCGHSDVSARCYQHPAARDICEDQSRVISAPRHKSYPERPRTSTPGRCRTPNDDDSRPLAYVGRPFLASALAVHSAVPRRLGLQGPKNVPETRANKRGFSCEGEALLGSTRLLVTLGARSATAGATLPLGPVRWFAAAEKRKVGYL